MFQTAVEGVTGKPLPILPTVVASRCEPFLTPTEHGVPCRHQPEVSDRPRQRQVDDLSSPRAGTSWVVVADGTDPPAARQTDLAVLVMAGSLSHSGPGQAAHQR
jgi:hypothetical protein